VLQDKPGKPLRCIEQVLHDKGVSEGIQPFRDKTVLLKQVSSNPLMVRKDQVLAVGNMIAGAMQITRPFKQDCLLKH
jgi:hypothetical protein